MARTAKPVRMFVAMPGDYSTQKWDDANDIKKTFFAEIAKAVGKRLGTRVEMVIEKDKPLGGSIHSSMFRETWLADIYLADLTGNNANVYLELGVRWTVRDKVTVLVSQDVQKVLFNARDARVFPYSGTGGARQNSIDDIVEAIVTEWEAEGHSDSVVRLGAEVVTVARAELDGLRGELSETQAENFELRRSRGEDLLTAALAASGEEKLRLLRSVIEVNPASAAALLELGCELRKQTRHGEAAEALEKAARLAPQCSDCYCELGVVYGKLGRLEDAVRAGREAVRVAPNDAEAFNNLAGNLRRWGTREAPRAYDWPSLREARDRYARAAELRNNDRYALVNVARLDLLCSRQEPEARAAAVAQFRRLQHLCAYEVERNPQDIWARLDLADTLLFTGDVEGGRARYQEAIAAVPADRPFFLVSAGAALKELADAEVLPEPVAAAAREILAGLDRLASAAVIRA